MGCGERGSGGDDKEEVEYDLGREEGLVDDGGLGSEEVGGAMEVDSDQK